MIQFNNTNTIWSLILAETLKKLGLKTVVICPGSRNAPLVVAFTQVLDLEIISILDERSAAYFALGLAKRTRHPVAIICTSGTAGANFYPAIIEAKESHTPLLILTADRPLELRNCHAPQAIDQVKLYGNYPNWQCELCLASLDLKLLAYARQTMIQAWERSLYPTKGPVHVNIPFREPLAPIPTPDAELFRYEFSVDNFLSFITPMIAPIKSIPCFKSIKEEWKTYTRGLIITGPALTDDHKRYVRAIAQLSELLQWPIISDASSGVRNYLDDNSYLITGYDIILRNRKLAELLIPDVIIQIGELPISKELRTWLSGLSIKRWIIDPSLDNFDPLHGKTIHLRISIEDLIDQISSKTKKTLPKKYITQWGAAESQLRHLLDQSMLQMDWFFEGKIPWILSQNLPAKTPVFVANSNPIRDLEWFWIPNQSQYEIFFNRGANGIDGIVSSALGMAYDYRSAILLTGDLTLLHDTNGLLINKKFKGHLTIILVNNNGGGIFEMLPISKFNPPFEEYFATPQGIDFKDLSKTYHLDYHLIESWEHLIDLINPLPSQGIRLLEIRSDRQVDAAWRQKNLFEIAQLLYSYI